MLYAIQGNCFPAVTIVTVLALTSYGHDTFGHELDLLLATEPELSWGGGRVGSPSLRDETPTANLDSSGLEVLPPDGPLSFTALRPEFIRVDSKQIRSHSVEYTDTIRARRRFDTEVAQSSGAGQDYQLTQYQSQVVKVAAVELPEIARLIGETEIVEATPEPIKYIAPNGIEVDTSILWVRYPGRVFFDTNKSIVRHEGHDALDRLANVLHGADNVQPVTVVGHTDSQGTDIHNMNLAFRRAEAAAQALASRGISRSQLNLAAAGERQPIASNATPEGRSINRRVEFLIGAEFNAHKAFIAQVTVNRDFLNDHGESGSDSQERIPRSIPIWNFDQFEPHDDPNPLKLPEPRKERWRTFP